MKILNFLFYITAAEIDHHLPIEIEEPQILGEANFTAQIEKAEDW